MNNEEKQNNIIILDNYLYNKVKLEILFNASYQPNGVLIKFAFILLEDIFL